MNGAKFPKYKYNFHDFKMDVKKVLPGDINDVLKDAVSPLACGELENLIDKIQAKRQFGTVFVMDNRGIQVSKIDFQSGICKKYDIVSNPENPVIQKPIHAIFLRSERNYMISFREKYEQETV